MRLGRHLSPLHLSFPLILVAVLALARYSYRTTEQMAARGEESLLRSITVIGDQMRDRVDNFIIDTDREFFNLVDLNNVSSARWAEVVLLPKAVEAAIVLDENQQIVKGGYVSKLPRNERADFQRRFLTRILPTMTLSDLRPDSHKHLHVHNLDGADYLISYIKHVDNRVSTGPADQRAPRTYYIMLKINLEYLTRTFFPELFAPVQGRVLYSVLDAKGSVLYGQAITGAGSTIYETSFPSTVYRWRLQMAPLAADRLRVGARRRLVTDTILIGISVAVILCGMVVLAYAISREQRANALKSEFISNVSHELKTPLSLIRMFAELLMLGKVKTPEKGREYAEIITRESERLSRLIDNVLDFARIERGKAAYDMKPGDLGEVVERALDFYRYRLEREGRHLEVEVPAPLPMVRMDENAMTLVLLNLVDNAMKYGGESPITVRLRAAGSEVQLSVIDRGPGVPEEEQRKIFERFYRARAVRRKNVRGSGIGLALVRHITEAHGGRVTVQSTPGQGATFTVALPAAPEEEVDREASGPYHAEALPGGAA